MWTRRLREYARNVASIDEYKEKRKALAASEGARLQSDLQALGRSFRVFMGNCDELLGFFNTTNDPAVAIQLWAVQNRAAFERFLDEVDRLLHNVVAAAMSLREHSYRVRDKWLKPDGRDKLREQYSERVKLVFAESLSAQLIEGLRVIVQHKKLPRLLGHASVTPGEAFESKIHLDSDDLLEWDEWKPEARAFLEESEDPLVLDEIVVEYREAVAGFHSWFGFAVAQRNVAALHDLERGKRELNEYGSQLFGQ
jgi:hypothetical protein